MTAVEKFLKAVDGTIEEREEVKKTYSKRDLKHAQRTLARIEKTQKKRRA